MSKPVHFSEAAFIGIHSLVIIALSKNNFVNVNTIANITGASRNHISKIMQLLVKAGLVSSVRGPNGGFSLAKDPSQITFLDIYEATEGKILIKSCPFEKPICPFDICLVNNIFGKITHELIQFLQNTTLKTIQDYHSLKNDEV
ncbi:MAG: Rrf2 family transcriptional regulator [Bacteroidales bacterium]|nr:Rrf2 family transcriptional regulator [Bacteroidales bacterium]